MKRQTTALLGFWLALNFLAGCEQKPREEIKLEKRIEEPSKSDAGSAETAIQKTEKSTEESGRKESGIDEAIKSIEENYNVPKEKKKLGDNITDKYKVMIIDNSDNKTSINCGEFDGRGYFYSEGWSNHQLHGLKHIEVKKGEAKIIIPFSKIEGIEFLEDLGKKEGDAFLQKAKISFWDGNSEEFIYMRTKGEKWDGKTSYGDIEIATEKIKKIIFLRE